MYNRHHRVWIAISVFTLAIDSSYPAIAKPQPKQVVTVSQLGSKSPVSDEIARPPVDAILASLKSKPSAAPRVDRTVRHQGVSRKSLPKATQSSRVQHSNRSPQGISHLIETDRNPHKTNTSAVDRLIK